MVRCLVMEFLEVGLLQVPDGFHSSTLDVLHIHSASDSQNSEGTVTEKAGFMEVRLKLTDDPMHAILLRRIQHFLEGLQVLNTRDSSALNRVDTVDEVKQDIVWLFHAVDGQFLALNASNDWELS
jgi:hypothetical protein